jgi:hypothetical protein
MSSSAQNRTSTSSDSTSGKTNIDSGLSTLKHQLLQKELIVQDYADQSTFLLCVEIRQ